MQCILLRIRDLPFSVLFCIKGREQMPSLIVLFKRSFFSFKNLVTVFIAKFPKYC